jgi:hypothetical protein
MTFSKNFEPVSTKEDEIGKIIVNSCYTVHSKLGPRFIGKNLRDLPGIRNPKSKVESIQTS